MSRDLGSVTITTPAFEAQDRHRLQRVRRERAVGLARVQSRLARSLFLVHDVAAVLAIVAPDGTLLGEPLRSGQGVVVADLDFALIACTLAFRVGAP